jgi:capsular polysaccharide biosynthesis protein
MSALQLVSAFEKEGIETIEIARRPLRGLVGRKPFPILDLRSKSEAAYEEAAQPHSYKKHLQYLAVQYATDPPLKEDPIFRAGPVTLFRGSVWHEGVPVLGSVHAKHEKDLLVWQQKVVTLADKPNTQRFPGVSAIIQAPGSRNYFHWIIEVSPRLFALREYIAQGLGPLDRILLVYEDPGKFVPQLLDLMFPDLKPLVEFTTGAITVLDQCLFFTDQKEYSDKHNSRWKTTTAFMSEAIDNFHAERPVGPARAYLVSRADAPTRQVVNEDLLIETFADRGLERIELGGLDLRQQMEVMSDATFVIGAHGAGMTNTIFCRPGAVVVELTSTQYIRRCRSFADISMYRNLNYGLAVVDQHGEQYVIEQNRGNDLEIAASAVQPLRALVYELSAT